MKKNYTVGGLFSGVGGIELGFINAGFEVLWATEIDKNCAKTYRNNYQHHLYEKSIKIRKKLINDIISDRDVSNSIKNYIRSKKESFWIPKLIAWRSHKLLEFACTLRAKKILRIRRKKI